MKRHTESEENYLKAIFKCAQGRDVVQTNVLARDLGTTPASVTDMLKKLKEKGLVEYAPYKGVQLTENGRQIALRIIRKHRLWEVFLVNVLKFRWDEVHDTAEQLEHIDSPQLIEKLDEFLGFPRFDPHGDPIPSAEGVIAERATRLLTEAEAGERVIMVGVLLHSPEYLQYLDKIGFGIGNEMVVKEKILYDNTLVLQMGERELLVGGETARHILVMLRG